MDSWICSLHGRSFRTESGMRWHKQKFGCDLTKVPGAQRSAKRVPKGGGGVGESLDDDPEIRKLRKELEKSRLETEIAKVQTKDEMPQRLEALEKLVIQVVEVQGDLIKRIIPRR